jgi:hypothetical protein
VAEDIAEAADQRRFPVDIQFADDALQVQQGAAAPRELQAAVYQRRGGVRGGRQFRKISCAAADTRRDVAVVDALEAQLPVVRGADVHDQRRVRTLHGNHLPGEVPQCRQAVR